MLRSKEDIPTVLLNKLHIVLRQPLMDRGCLILLSGVCVTHFLLSVEVGQEGCVKSLYLNMLPAGREVEDTECV